MLAGGLANMRPDHVLKRAVQPGNKVIVLGGPAMLIGLGGGAASSVASGTSSAELDFASVQRDNAEMERRCQQVIDGCWPRGEKNPIVSIHDVGAGGLSNAIPELLNDAGVGGAHRPVEDSLRRPVAVADAGVEQRIAGALRAGDRRGGSARVRGLCAGANVARTRWSARPPPSASWW